MNPLAIMNSPWAKFTTSVALKMRTKPKSGHTRFVHLCGKLGLFLGGYILDSRGDLRRGAFGDSYGPTGTFL